MQLESFCQFCDQEYKHIIKYISTSQLSLEAAVSRALRLLPSPKSYFLSEEDQSPRFERLREHFENPMLEAYLLFYQFSLKVFIKLNLLLQREDPLISRVHGHIQRFLKKLALKFLNLDVIDENDNPAQIDFEDTNNQKSGNVKKGVLRGLILRFLYSVNLIRRKVGLLFLGNPMTMIFVKINLTFTFLLCLILYVNHQNYRPRQIMDPPIHCCHTDTLLCFDTIIHYVLLYFKYLHYCVLFSICSDQQLEVCLNTRCKISRMFNDGDISQHQKNKFHNSARVFCGRAFRYALDNLPHSDELLKHVELINWEHCKDTTINSITYFVQR